MGFFSGRKRDPSPRPADAIAIHSGRNRRRDPLRNALCLEILESRLAPSFVAPLNYDTAGGPTSLAVGDFNGDGIPDLALAS
jgi:hypothetical protein